MPTVETVMWRAERWSAAVQPLDRAPDRGLVGERLAHAHEHDVRDPPTKAASTARCPHDLFDDLTGRELPRESGLAGGAEPAAHRTAGLGGDAHGGAIGIEHEDRLDAGTALELPQELDRVGPVAHIFDDRVERHRQLLRQSGAQRSRQVRQLGGVGQMLVEPLPDLVDAVPGLTDEQGAEGVTVVIETGEHRVEATGGRPRWRRWRGRGGRPSRSRAGGSRR